ncbi:hypothetical protein M9H77_04211 [Catharanthus roseus]|uniref:Uncharacterized protein n=1 Tax=Catharanthus roseus TaxID=4058 RepID=A0ACC0CDV5_CATRO|nr:hypothetical protein M9H77_04211 [Catharanthus roseus]
MGLSAYPTAADVGIICMILSGAADLVSLFKCFIFSSLEVIVGIKIQPTDEFGIGTNNMTWSSFEPENSIKKRIPLMKYFSLKRSNKPNEEYCSICLTEFEAISMINQLPCGHYFHSNCLETWLRSLNLIKTCPLCRKQISLRESM